MARHIWSIPCREAIIDRFSNSLTLVGVLEELQVTITKLADAPAEPRPVGTADFVVVSHWVKSDGPEVEDFKLRSRFYSPSGKLLGQSEHQFSFKEYRRARNVLNVRGLPLPEEGQYTIELQEPSGESRWKTVAKLPLDVKIKIVEAPVTVVAKEVATH